MSLNPEEVRTLLLDFIPARFLTCEVPNNFGNYFLHTSNLRLAVLDSYIYPFAAFQAFSPVAVLIVPPGRETDWIFSTYIGHLHLLPENQQFTRLILIGNNPIADLPVDYIQQPINFEQRQILENYVDPFVRWLCPLSPYTIFLSFFDDNVVRSKIVKVLNGHTTVILIEDVQMEDVDGNNREFTRRMRFRIFPRLIQTEVPIRLFTLDDTNGIPPENTWPLIDPGVLVQPNLIAMVAGLSLMSIVFHGRMKSQYPVKVLCLGVGGGALLRFLNEKLGFHVVGVDEDVDVLRAAGTYFGLNDSDSVRLIVGDGVKLIRKFSKLSRRSSEQRMDVLDDFRELKGGHLIRVDELYTRYDAIMVDLDPSKDDRAVFAPPSNFVNNQVLDAARKVLEGGILVINVISPQVSFSHRLGQMIGEVFPQLYGIPVGAGDSFVGVGDNLVGTGDNFIFIAGGFLHIASLSNPFFRSLRSLISGPYLESITQLNV